MKTTLCVGAAALAMASLLPALPAAQASERTVYAAEQGATSIDVARIKGALRLTAEQERYWPPVEAALRAIARGQARAEPGGLVHRLGRRIVAVVLDSVAVQRLAAAARPLIATLDAEQMQAASNLAQEMGLGPVVAALR